MSTKIIHIFNDDKFVDAAISIMEFSHPNESEYYVIKNDENDFNYVKSGIVKRLKLTLDKDYSDFIQELKNKNSYVVFLHALDLCKQKMVLLLPDKIVKVWLIWGYDLYGNWQLFNDKLYEKKTIQALDLKKPSLKIQLINNSFSFWLFDKTNKKAVWLPKKIFNILKSNFYNHFYKAAEKIDIVIPVIENEYAFIKKLKLQPKLGTFSYGTLEDLLKGNTIDNVLNKTNILLGNSADPSNNHLDVFDKLRNFNLKDRKLFVPLSYSGTVEYKAKVIVSGKKIFDKFTAIGGNFFSTISPKASIGHFGNFVDEGSNIMTGTVITNDITIGKGVLVNLNCTIGHDTKIGEFVELSPGVHISGNCSIGDYSVLGTNSTVLPKVAIGKNVIIGAGSVVTKDLPDNCVAVGIPAKVIKELPQLEF